MTSANVIEYTILDKDNKEVGRHRQHIMCQTCNDGLEKFQPSESFKIKAWGYDEEECEWEGKTVNLKDWLSKHPASITFKRFNVGDTINIKKLGEGEILEFFDIFKKGRNWFPLYSVRLSSGDIVEIKQGDIKPS